MRVLGSLGAALLAALPAGDVHYDCAFGRGLLKLDDQDGDGIAELLIVDSTHRDGGPTRFYVWSPGADRCIRSFDHDTWIDDEPYPVVRVGGLEEGDAAYVGVPRDKQSLRAHVVLFSTSTGAEVRRVPPLKDFRYSWSPIGIWNLGEVDEVAGDEVLVRYSIVGDDVEEPVKRRRRAVVLSLATCETLRDVEADVRDVIGDLDGDGVAEILVGGKRRPGLRDGATGSVSAALSVLHESKHWLGGSKFRACSDLNGDGSPDVLVTDSDAGWDETPFTSETRLLSGETGELLWSSDRVRCTGYTSSFTTSIDDHDGDETPDVLLANALGVDGWEGCPDWRILSGATGEVIRKFEWDPSGSVIWARGTSVAVMDDLDGDGLRDVAFSHTKARHQGYGDGFVSLHSTKTGRIRRIWLSDVADEPSEEAAIPVDEE